MAKREETIIERICSTVGLNESFFQDFDFDSFPKDIQEHQTIEQWIYIFLYQKYQETTRGLLSEAEWLTSLGFRQDSIALKTICTRIDILQGHIEPFECAKYFIQDEFKYNVLLSETSHPRFPMNLPHLNKWCILSKEIQSRENATQPCFLINLEKHEASESKISQLLTPNETENRILLFHGTDHKSALDIFDEGIDLYSGSQKRDFSDGNGFYLVNELNCAIRMAFGKTSKPAVLVYQIPKTILTKFAKYSLCGKEKETEWKAIVSQCREGRQKRKLRKFLENIDFIEGPMANSYKLPPVAKKGSYQICAISDDFGEELDNHIRAIIFLDGMQTFSM